MSRYSASVLLLWVSSTTLAVPTPTRAQGGAGLSAAEIARLGRPATALVFVEDTKKEGSSFCVHPSGLFVTNHHVISHFMPRLGRDARGREIQLERR